MKFDGMNFRINRNIVILKNMDGSYVRFGRIVPEGKSCPPNAEATMSKWSWTGQPVMAVPIPVSGYSLTNMAYGEDGRIYLAYDGMCYTHKSKKAKKTRKVS